MKNSTLTDSQNKPAGFVAVFLMPAVIILVAISVNILLTLQLDDSHIGIRVAATDFMIPLIMLFVISGFLLKKESPSLCIRWGWQLLVLMSVWMLISFIVGYQNTGVLMTWALVNKLAGWVILMCYFVSGVYIGQHGGKTKKIFFRSLLFMAWLVCAVELVAHWFFLYGFLHQ